MVTLTRWQNTNLYLVSGANQSSARFAAVADPNSALPATVALNQTWGPWRYAFFDRNQASGFLANGAALWNQMSGQGIRVAWFQTTGSIVPQAMLTLPENAPIGSQIANTASFTFQNYHFHIPNAARLSIGNLGFHLDLHGANGPATWNSGNGNVEVVGTDLWLDIVDERSLGVSRFRFDLEFHHVSTGGRDDFDNQDAGLRFFRNAFSNERLPVTSHIVTRRFRVFEVRGGSVPLKGYLDYFEPVSPVTQEPPATRFEFSSSASRLLTPWRLTFGHRVVVAPDPAGGLKPSLVLTSRVDHRAYYFCPRGDFQIADFDGSPAPDPRALRFACGNSGSEYIRFWGHPVLRFEPGGDAFYTIPEPPRQAGDLPVDTQSSGLSNRATTAWVRWLSPASQTASSYRTQPDDAPSYAPNPFDPDNDGATVSAGVFAYQQIPLKSLSAEPGPTVPVPLVAPDGLCAYLTAPFQGMTLQEQEDWTAREYTALEALVLYPRRRSLIKNLAPPPPPPFTAARAAPVPQKTVTPQGLLAEIDPANDFEINSVWLARSPDDDTNLLKLSGVNNSAALVDALRQNKLFAVMSRLPTGVTLDGNLGMAKWTFQVGLPALSSTPPVNPEPPLLIFKLYDGVSIADLANDTGSWTRGNLSDDWTVNVANDQAVLRHYIEDIQNRLQGELADQRGHSLYRQIHDRLHDPHWNGILAIHVALNPNSLPRELKALSIGIEGDKFILNHLGITANRYKKDTGSDDISLDRSSLFGLLDYHNDQDLQNGLDFTFTVERLQALFDQSRLTQFAGLVRLKVVNIFKQDYTKGETAKLIGSYERHDGIDTYSFATRGEVAFEFDGSLVEKIVLERAQFTSETDGTVITARFVMSASLALGQRTSTAITKYFCLQGLSCRNLIAEFRFDSSGGANQHLTTGKFQPGLLAFDFADTQKCSTSLLSLLPVDFQRFYFAVSGATEDIRHVGFFPMIGQNFDFGFSFRIKLGGLGALVSSRKKLEAEILLGWQAPLNDVVIGFRLPGGSLDLGIQGVLKLTIEEFQFYDDGQSANPYYALLLKNCRLALLGLTLPPSASRCDIGIFPNPADPLQSPVGWFGGLPAQNDAFWGLGQRLEIRPKSGEPPTFSNVLGTLRDFVQEFIAAIDNHTVHAFLTDPDAAHSTFGTLQYNPQNDWTAAFNYKFGEVVTLGVIFNDPSLYGVRVDTSLFGIDVVYRKINDDLGEYTTEIRLPDALRQIEVGAASLTLPVIGLDLFTNGDFRVDLGFPWRLDFSRSFSLQVLPFIGGGGFYVGRLRGSTSGLVPGADADPNAMVAVFGFGLRIGLGKEIEKGIFRAGLSVTLYGILEGALAYAPGSQDVFKPKGWALVGRVGILGQLFGAVDFGIIKVNVTITIEVGMPFEYVKFYDSDCWRISAPAIEANVHAEAEVEIGSIRVFGKTISITVSFSYSFHLRVDLPFTVSSPDCAHALRARETLALASAVAALPIAWESSNFSQLWEVIA